jgi:hypothetical protein
MMLVDCQTCPVRDVHCADCMVTALTVMTAPTALTEMHLRPAPSGPHSEQGDVVTAPLDRAERRAVSAFLAAGLVSTATANALRAELDPAETASHHRARRAV